MLNEKKLTKAELDKREDIIMKMKKNKRSLVDKYGKDAEAVMYGRATNIAKKKEKPMKDNKLSELIKDALTNPKAADLNKDGKLSDYEETRGKAIEKNLKETLDDDVWMKVDALKNYLRGEELIDIIVRAMSTDDANFYLDAVMRDYDIDNPMDINLDNLEEVGGYDRKGNKEIEPTGDVKRRKVGIGNALEENKNVMSNIMQYWDRTDTMINDLREFILAAKDAGGDDLVREIADALKLMTNYALGEYKKLTSLKDIKETIKQMKSINEKAYPFDKCLDDNEKKYGKKGAARVCGSIRSAFGESLEVDKKKKLKEASGPATIEDTEKAARKVVAAIKLEQPEDDVKVSRGLEEGSFDIDINDRNYDGGSYTVDSDGDITLVSIRKPGFVGNLNDAASTIQSTMNDVLTNSPSKSGPAYSPENNE